MRILMTGGTGFLGRHLSAALLAQGHSLTVLSRRPETVRKICGNAQRWKRRAFLHHGTILYDFDLAKIERYLRLPARQPDYRAGRAHHHAAAACPSTTAAHAAISSLRQWAIVRSPAVGGSVTIGYLVDVISGAPAGLAAWASHSSRVGVRRPVV